jgi:acetoacetate decarboxylase
MSLRGFSLPLSPEGRASLTPTPPWHYAGTLLLVDFETDPEAIKAVLPPRVEPDPADPGGAVAFFVSWQYASAAGDEYLDPIRSQYHEFILLTNATYKGRPVNTCPYIYVDKDTSLARGWIQGWPKKLGEVHMTVDSPLVTKAAPQVGPGGRFGGTLSASGRRLAETVVTLERISDDPLYLGKRPVINMRYFPQLAGGGRAQPPVWELVRSLLADAQRTEVWEGTADLRFFPAPDQELDALQPVRVRRGYRYNMSFTVNDLEVLERLG